MNTTEDFYTVLFNELTQEMATTQPDESTLHPLRDGEIVRGILSDDLRRLYTVKEKCAALFFSAQEALHNNTIAPCPQVLRESLVAYMRRYNILKHMFWDGVESRYHVRTESIGIRSGWRVVEMPDTMESDIQAGFVFVTMGTVQEITERFWETEEGESETPTANDAIEALH